MPEEPCSIVLSVQTLHNLPLAAQERAMAFVHDRLAGRGLFLNLDRIKVGSPGLYGCYRSVWRRLEELHDDAIDAVPDYEGYWREWRARDEYPMTLGQNITRLRGAGFEAACLHLHGDRALFAARKAQPRG